MAAGVAINGIVKSFQFGAKLWGQLRVPSGAAKTVTQSIAKSADDVAKASAKVADDAVKATAKKADDVAQDAIKETFTNRAVLKVGKIGLYGTGATLAITAEEWATGNFLAKNIPPTVNSALKKISGLHPDIEKFFKTHGIDAAIIAADIADTGENVKTELLASSLDEAGLHEGGNFVRLHGSYLSPSLIGEAATAPEGKRFQTYITELVDQSGVPEKNVKEFFIKNRTMIGLVGGALQIDENKIYNELGIDVSPKLANATEVKVTGPNTPSNMLDAAQEAGQKLDTAREQFNALSNPAAWLVKGLCMVFNFVTFGLLQEPINKLENAMLDAIAPEPEMH